jgi:hypothetical protein
MLKISCPFFQTGNGLECSRIEEIRQDEPIMASFCPERLRMDSLTRDPLNRMVMRSK